VIGLWLFQPLAGRVGPARPTRTWHRECESTAWGGGACLQCTRLDVSAYSNFRCTTVASTWRLACAIRRAKVGRIDVL
jgi:hypothetical protein